MQFKDINLIILRENFSKNSTLTDLERVIQEKSLKNIGLVLKSIVKEDKIDKNQLPIKEHVPMQSPIQLSL